VWAAAASTPGLHGSLVGRPLPLRAGWQSPTPGPSAPAGLHAPLGCSPGTAVYHARDIVTYAQAVGEREKDEHDGDFQKKRHTFQKLGHTFPKVFMWTTKGIPARRF